jgi:hypothetical protein
VTHCPSSYTFTQQHHSSNLPLATNKQKNNNIYVLVKLCSVELWSTVNTPTLLFSALLGDISIYRISKPDVQPTWI